MTIKEPHKITNLELMRTGCFFVTPGLKDDEGFPITATSNEEETQT